MKKIGLSPLRQKIITLFLLALLPLLASATTLIDGIYYNLNSNTKEAEVTHYGDAFYTGSVTIPESFIYDGVTYSVTSIERMAFRNCSGLTSVTIGNSVTSIENSAFYGCSGLASVTIGNSVTGIGYWAFYDCSSLTSIEIPNSVTSIGGYAFSSCSGLTSVTIGSGVTSIGNSAFYGCSFGKKDFINNSSLDAEANNYWGATVVDSGENGFVIKDGILIKYTGNEASVTIPNSVTSIGQEAFYGCSSLTSIEIPNSVTEIGNYAFSSCSGLTSVTIPNSVTSIGNYAFSSCSALTDVYCYAENVPTTSSDAFAYSGIDNITLHVPEASLTSYHATAPWSYGFIVAIGSDMDVEKYSTKARYFTLYYDYDGDGIMEYFGSNNSYDNYENKGGIYDYKGQLLQESNYPKGIPINGNGDILFYKDNYKSSTFSVEGIEEAICTIADIDNDGRKDLVVDPSISSNQEGHFTIYYQQPDGTFQPTEQLWTKDAEAAMAEGSSGGGGGSVAFLRSFLTAGMFVDARKAHFSTWDYDESDNMARNATRSVQAISSVDGSYRTLDMNYDGINDLLTSGSSSTVLYSYADNKFYVSYKKGGLYPCDLNGDSELDFISYDGNSIILMTRTGGETYDEKNLFTNSNVEQIIYKDFDHDGDIDILAYINSSSYGTLRPTYFVFFRNDGDMSFKRRERNFADSYLLKEIKDVDADGLYEMLVYDENNSQVRLLKIGENLSLTEETGIDFGNVNISFPIAVGDYDNDGLVDYRYAVNASAIIYGRFSQAVNTAPERMSAPTALLDADTQRLRINWKQGSDTETSSCDLTYELRIGTEPASGDVLFGASLADGTRRTFEEGNMGRSLSTLFNAKSLKPGKYYISVQAVDGGGRGGAWSEDFVYEHQLAAPVIVSNFTNQMTSADTIRLSVKAPIDGAEYKWTVSEGRQIESDGDDTRYIFERDGKHTVNLSMTYDGRTLNASPLELVVTPAKKCSNCSGREYSCGFVDFNQDGYPEYLGYVNDGQGNLENVLLSYATQYSGKDKTYVLDFNMDGYPDVWCSDNVLINLGEQDNDFDVTTEEIDEGCYGYDGRLIFDANNDGYLDTPYGYNNGTNRGWNSYRSTDSKYALYDNNGRVTNFNNSYGYYELGSPNYDVNRDGMLDIVTVVGKHGGNNTRWYVMYKDSTANMDYTTPQLMYEIDGDYEAWSLEDLNSDGYVDIIMRDYYTRELTIVKGCATLPYKETIRTNEEIDDSYTLHDYNNDGYIDIHWYNNKLIKFGPDFVEEVIEDVLLPSGYYYYNHYYFMVQKDGGYPDKYESHIKNLPPSAPATVAAKQTKDGMLITWSDAQDDHTPAMQMRYNISVKRKGKKGDNSFVISPLNGLKDAATICGSMIYKKSTQMLVPASVLTAGETYEIQVQAIDLWNQHSPMTKAVEFTMTSSGYVDVAEKVVVGKETKIKFVGTQSGSYSLAAGDDATIVSNNGNGEFIVKWSKEGVKELVLTAGTKTIKSSVTVVKPVDLTFTVPEQVYANAPLTVAVSDEMASEPKNVGMRVTGNSKIKVDYSVGSKIATVTFPSTGTYELEAYSTDDIRGNSYKQTVNVTESMPTPTIEQVGVDAETGYYAINWNAATLPSDISRAIISKEGTTTDIFSAIDTVDVEVGRFIDKSSNPVVQTSRYTIRLVADNGQISENSLPHKPLHVMLMKGVVGYNLIWNSYGGLDVQGYSILRGSSPDNMEPIAQVAGSINNYTDITAPSGINYYAVTIRNGTSQKARSASREVTDISYEAISSNVISTESAIEGVSAKSIEIVTLDNDKTLNDEHKELQLYTLILPTYSTVSTVMWEITEGKSLASIDNNGMLHGKGGTGNVTVQARTIDESELSAEISIPVSIQKTVLRGDVNGDGKVDMDDATFVTNVILGIEYATEEADVNNDGSVNMADVMFIVNYIKNGNFPDE